VVPLIKRKLVQNGNVAETGLRLLEFVRYLHQEFVDESTALRNFKKIFFEDGKSKHFVASVQK
jgi:hypothetical protein